MGNEKKKFELNFLRFRSGMSALQRMSASDSLPIIFVSIANACAPTKISVYISELQLIVSIP